MFSLPEPQNYEALSQPARAKLRKEYELGQGGLCHHCGARLSGKPTQEIMALPINLRLFPPNFLRWPVHLHHSHKTHMTIGAVHARCNAVLWQYHNE